MRAIRRIGIASPPGGIIGEDCARRTFTFAG